MRRLGMKRQAIICLFAVAVAGARGVRAETFGDIGRGGCRSGAEMLPPPEEMVGQMARQLHLTTEQQAKVTAIFAADREKIAPLVQQRADYRKQLRTAMQAATFDEAAIRAAAARQFKAEIELMVSGARVRNRIDGLLTKEQRSLEKRVQPPFPLRQGPPPCGCGRDGHMPPPGDDEWIYGSAPGCDNERR